jgi:hypothetical protein
MLQKLVCTSPAVAATYMFVLSAGKLIRAFEKWTCAVIAAVVAMAG